MPQNAPERDETVVSAEVGGELVELIYRAQERKTLLVAGTATESRAVESLTVEQRTLKPISAQNNLLRHGAVLLPSDVGDFESPTELAERVVAYIDRYLDLSPSFRLVAAWYVLLTWVYDAFNELPYLRFRGDFGTGKSRALTVIGSVCYKPFFASGASTISPIFHILDRFRGTLVLDEADFRFSDEKSELVKVLNNGNVKGFPVLRNTLNERKEFDPRAFQVFGPKLLSMRHSFEDEALESRCLTEDMGQRPLREDIPINLPGAQGDEAAELRNALLAYRFRYRGQVKIDPGLVDASRSARVNQLLVPLLSIIEDGSARRTLQFFSSGIDEELAFDRSQRPEALVLRAVLDLQGRSPGKPVPVSDITKVVVDEFGRDFDRYVTPRYIGELLRRRLRLTTYKSHSVYVLAPLEETRIGFLRERFGL